MKSKKHARIADAERRNACSTSPMDSPKGQRASGNASNVFSLILFLVVLAAVMLGAYAAFGTVDVWVVVASFAAAIIVSFNVRIAAQWERVVILRLGKFNRVAGPGLYATIPLIEYVSLRADQRIMMTSFEAEETLTSDLVPVNVDAVIFWMVWDAKKACTEVEDYYDAVALTSQTALREEIGRRDLSDVTIHRNQIDKELQEIIEEKTSTWGVSVMSVEIRDIVIPKKLQEAMATAAAAERQKDARVVLADIEKEVASMLVDAAKVYREDEMAFDLRSMHLLSEGVNRGKGTLVVPSAWSESFKTKE